MFIFLINTVRAAVSLPDFSKSDNVPSMISAIYAYSLTIVGIIVFVRFFQGGWMYLTSAGGADQTGRAKEIMWNAVIGAVILFSSYLILYVINPDLVCNTFNFGIPNSTNAPATQKCK